MRPNLGSDAPRVLPGGLSTVAFLTAQLDSSDDYLGIFMPLVLDVVSSDLCLGTFTTEDVYHKLLSRHKISMPLPTITTLLQRATHRKLLKREAHRYCKTDKYRKPKHVDEAKASISAEQRRLSVALIDFAKGKQLYLTTDRSLQLLYDFLELEHVALLVDATSPPTQYRSAAETPETVLAAQFVVAVLTGQIGLDIYDALMGLLQGLVLYKAAFLPDLAVNPAKRFDGLQLCFDTSVILGLLGFQGSVEREYLIRAISVLKQLGARCGVFEATLREVDGILSHYENLSPSTFLRDMQIDDTSLEIVGTGLGRGGIQLMRSQVGEKVRRAGIAVLKMPRRVPALVGDEAGLAEALINPVKHDRDSPRIRHDVDCIAAIRVFRNGHMTNRLVDARAVFVSSSASVIETVRKHYEMEGGNGTVPPMVHLRAVTNIAWLKMPHPTEDLKVFDAIALCSAAMKPSPQMWARFTKHLSMLVEKKEMTNDQAVSIAISSMTEFQLKDAELRDGVDAKTFDAVIEAVRAEQAEHFKPQVEEAERRAAEAEAAAKALRETMDRNERKSRQRRENLLLKAASFAVYVALAIGVGALAIATAAAVIGIVHTSGVVGGVISGMVIFGSLVALLLHIEALMNRSRTWVDALASRLDRLLRRLWSE